MHWNKINSLGSRVNKQLISSVSRNKSIVIKSSVILFAIIAIYNKDFILIGNQATQSELMSYMLAIPFLTFYLIYRKRKMLKAVASFETSKRENFFFEEFVGALLCIQAILLYWHGSYTFHPLEYHMISLPLFIAGCTLAFFNLQMLKILAFPTAFLLFLTPPPSETIYIAGATLSVFSSKAAFTILKVLGLPVSLATRYEMPIITLEKSQSSQLEFAIDIPCAGIYSLLGFTVFAAFVAYIARGTAWKRATIFLIGLPLFYVLNIVRIFTIVLIGNSYGIEVAMQAFHLFGGWVIIVVGTFILLGLSEKILKVQLFTVKSRKLSCPNCYGGLEVNQNFCYRCGRLLKITNLKIRKKDLSKVAVLIVCAGIIALLQIPSFSLTKGPPQLTLQTVSGEQMSRHVLPEIPDYTLSFVFRDSAYEKRLQQDASLTYVYIPKIQTETPVWVTIEIAKLPFSFHGWEVCFGGQPAHEILDLRDVQILEDPPIIGRFFAYQDTNSKKIQVFLYWYERVLFETESRFENKYTKTSLIVFINDMEEISKIEEHLLSLGKTITNYWQPVKTWSPIILLVSQNGMSLISITIALLIITLTHQAIKRWKERGSNLRAYNKLANQEQLTIEAVHQAAELGNATIDAIASTYYQLTGKPIEPSTLRSKLNQAEEASFIRRQIVSQEDEPIITWKNQFTLSKNI